MEVYNTSCSDQDFREYQFIRTSPRHWYVLLCVVNVVFSISATVENSIILLALFQCRTISSSSKALFYSLALSDFGVGMVAQPLQVATALGALHGNLELFCSIQPFYAVVAYFFCAVSFSTTTAISIERYLALRLRIRYGLITTMKKVTLVVVLLWICSSIWAVSRMWNIRINKISAIILGFSSIVITSSCYFRIYQTLRASKTRVTNEAATRQPRKTFNMILYRKSVNSMLTVFGFLVACYTPYFCAIVGVALLGYSSPVVLSTNLTSFVIFLNSSINPFVYCWRIREIRSKVMLMMRKLPVH